VTHRFALAAAAAFAFSCGGVGRSPSGYPLDPAIASAIPADTVALAGGRIDLLQKSPVFAKLKARMPAGAMAEYQTRFGIDPYKDLKEFAIAYNGKDPLLLASGPRLKEQLEKVVKDSAGMRTEHKGKLLIAFGGGGVAALSDTVLAAGPLPRLRECIDRMAQSSKLDERWAASLRTLPAAAQIFFLSAGAASLNLPMGSNLGNIEKILSSVESLAAWGDLSKSVRAAAIGSARDADAAKQLHTQLRGLIGLGRLSTPDNKPELLKFYDAVQVKQDGKTVEVDIDLPEAVLDTLIQQFRP
jgi:hypothetical protein